MTIRVIVNGAAGKMGQFACETLDQHKDFALVGRLGRGNNLSEKIQELQADVVVDLTRADAVFDNSIAIINNGAHPVIGTSGLTPEQIQELKQLAKEKHLGGLIVPNFSLSAVLMMHFASQAARYLHEVEIIEMHHPQKFDAPSGTAMKTAELILQQALRTEKEDSSENELIIGARGARHAGIPIHSVRLPGVLARQEVIFGNVGETLTLTHNTLDRSSFMPGLILACQRVMTLEELHYGLETVLL